MKSSLLPTSPTDTPDSQGPAPGAAGSSSAPASPPALRSPPPPCTPRRSRSTAADTESDPAPSEGYRLTDHVRRYYETTRT